jgi:SRSO17 transposase
LKNYCKGLLLPGDRKSIEPMAARLDPENIQPMRQSLHHFPEAVKTQIKPRTIRFW